MNNAVIYLASCAINEKTPDINLVAEMNLKDVYHIASKHMISAIVAVALEAAGYKDERSNRAITNAFRKTVLFETEKEVLFKQLEYSEIWYMPLKGAVLKDFYPKPFMREMSDYDILFDATRAKDVKRIMKNLNFSVAEFAVQNEDVYHKPPFISFEMHRSLFGARHEEKINKYYKDVKKRLVRDKDKKCAFHFRPEDFYIYIVAHEYIHYSTAGTGLRSLIDTYVFLQKHNIDWKYVNTEIEKLRISDFENQNRRLSLSLFNCEVLTSEDKSMLEYIINSGTYGTAENYIRHDIAKSGRCGYFLKRLTLPYAQMLEEYSILQKMPILYPFCWLSRLLIRGLFLRRKRLFQQLRAVFKR